MEQQCLPLQRPCNTPVRLASCKPRVVVFSSQLLVEIVQPTSEEGHMSTVHCEGCRSEIQASRFHGEKERGREREREGVRLLHIE